MAEIRMDGVDALIEKLNAINANMSKITNTALKAAAVPVLQDAKGTSAFTDRTGKLRRLLKTSGVKTKDGIKYVLVGIDKSDNSQIFYGKFLEFGTTKMSARPFLQPALEKNKSTVNEIIKDTLKAALTHD